jgi:hypothetical protein
MVAESRTAVMLVREAGVSLLLRRTPIVDEETLCAGFHPRRLGKSVFHATFVR